MAAESYRILFDGQLIEGKDPNEVKARLARLFGKSTADIEPLFSGETRLLKTVRKLDDARKMVNAFAWAGAVARLVPSRREERPQEAEDTDGTLLEPVGFGYRARITGAALAVGLIWLFHFLVLGAFTAALLYHLIFHLSLYVDYGATALLLHTLPGLAGVVLLAVLVKPLLPLRTRAAADLPLEPAKHPELFGLIEDLCSRAGAPLPRSVAVDSGTGIELDFGNLPEVSAKPPGLRLGLTLLNGMSVRQFAGLVGRELGYLARTQATWPTQFVRASHQRLRRAVFVEDELDRILAELELRRAPIALVGRFARKLIAFSRDLHRGLLRLVHAVSSAPLISLEYRLDAFQARLIGSDAFRGSISRRHLLELALKAASVEEERRWKTRGMLTDRLPTAAIALARERSEQLQREIRAIMTGATAGMYEARPTDLPRIARVEAHPQEAHYTDSRPAYQLLVKFDRLARRASYLYYRNALHLPVTADRLSSNSTASCGVERLLHRYLLDLHRAPVTLNPDLPEDAAGALRPKLQSILKRLRNDQARTGPTLVNYFEIERQRVEAQSLEAMALAKLPLPDGSVKLEEIHRECRRLENDEEKALKRLQECAQLLSQRLAIGLFQLNTGAYAPMATEIGRLRAVLRRTEKVMPQLRELRTHALILELLLSNLPSRNSALSDRINERAADLNQLLVSIRLHLRGTPWPFDPAIRHESLAIEGKFECSGPDELLDLAETVLAQTLSMRLQILVRLVQLAVSGERHLLSD